MWSPAALHACTSCTGRYALQYHTYIILEGAGSKYVVAFVYDASLGYDNFLFGNEGDEAFCDVSDE